MYINKQSAVSAVKELGIEPILHTEGGVIAVIPKHQYHAINAHSKHRIEPALKTGLDYEHAENDDKAASESDSMKDGDLLHCLTLEEAEFESRYRIQPDFDAKYKDYSLYFRTTEELKAFISAHNKQHQELVDNVNDVVKQFNADQLNEVPSTIAFDELPATHQTGEVGKRAIKKCLEEYQAVLLTPVDLSIENGSSLELAVKDKYQKVHALTAGWLNASFSKKWSAAKDWREKGRLINQVINEQDIKFHSHDSDEAKLAMVPNALKLAHYTEASKKAAVKAYVAEQKEKVFYLDAKLPLEDLLAEAKKYGLPIKDSDKVYQTKLPTLATKHETKGTWQQEDIIAVVTAIYGKPALYKPMLVAQEQQVAEEEKRVLVSSERYDHAKRIVKAVYENEDARKWLTLDDNLFEVAILWNDPTTGDLCKGMCDVLNLGYNVITDIKFVRTVDFDKLERDCGQYNYHIQNAMYERGFNQVVRPTASEGTVAELNKFIFITVEKDAAKLGAEQTKPIRIRVTEYIDRSDIARAGELIDGAIFRINKWAALGEYEGFKGITGIRVPVYQKKLENELLDSIRLEKDAFEKQLNEKGLDPLATLQQTIQNEDEQVNAVEMDIDMPMSSIEKAPLPRPDQLFVN